MAHSPMKVLTIAGSDSGGGAGIQADLKTFMALETFGMSVITAVTAQNTLGVQGVEMLSATFVGQQIDSVLSDLGADAIKTGMLGTREIVEIVAAKIQEYKVSLVVVDPVMISTSGHALLQPDGVEAYKERLFPVATVITPNIKEAEHLLGYSVRTLADMERAARDLHKFGPKAVLVKGGDKHDDGGDDAQSMDVLYDGVDIKVLSAPRVQDTCNVHGTGCTLASAIAAQLARDPEANLHEAVTKAKNFITEVLLASKGLQLGGGKQKPMLHATFTGLHTKND